MIHTYKVMAQALIRTPVSVSIEADNPVFQFYRSRSRKYFFIVIHKWRIRATFLGLMSTKEFRCKEMLKLCQSAKCSDRDETGFWKEKWHQFLSSYNIMRKVNDDTILDASYCQKWLQTVCCALNNMMIEVVWREDLTED
jgi:hypothetical protein